MTECNCQSRKFFGVHTEECALYQPTPAEESSEGEKVYFASPYFYGAVWGWSKEMEDCYYKRDEVELKVKDLKAQLAKAENEWKSERILRTDLTQKLAAVEADRAKLIGALAEIVQRSLSMHGLSTDKSLLDIARNTLAEVGNQKP